MLKNIICVILGILSTPDTLLYFGNNIFPKPDFVQQLKAAIMRAFYAVWRVSVKDF